MKPYSPPDVIPVVLFAYARVDRLAQTLACLRENQVPLIYAFSDGAKTPEQQPTVDEVRKTLRSIDWCEVILTERETNWGLGRSILGGVSEVFKKHNAIIVFEDDLICVPGTYQYLCAALEHYQDDPRVMSVTAYNHPIITPDDAGEQPYFDGRFQSLAWGAWARSWEGMDQTALELMQACKAKGIDPAHYGADLPFMAKQELHWNVWAIRFIYWHILNGGLVLHPHQSMVDHIGFDDTATNAKAAEGLENNVLQLTASIPKRWPEPIENPKCVRLYQERYKHLRPLPHTIFRIRRRLHRIFGI
ncbi:MAG: hypothetical protein IT319_15305 [Anaerolineae bacterium]|nr:hypothetical protein [Anaerolineae bacterium]